MFPWRLPEVGPRTLDPYERIERFGWQAEHAAGTWKSYIWLLLYRYFNAEDFYVVGHQNPARSFLQESILSDPRLLIGDTERFFDLPKLEMTMDMSGYDEQGIEPEDWEFYHPDQRWFIPVYPGMTADDLREAVPRIIEQVQKYLGPQTVGARIEELHAQKLTQQVIADALGLNVKVVQAHLRTVREQEQESEISPTKLTGS
jgi:hypothetical protein